MDTNQNKSAAPVAEVAQVTKRAPGRPKGHKVDWSQLKGNDWRYMSDKQIAEKVGTSVPNVWTRRKKLNALGQAKYTGKPVKRGRKPLLAKKKA